MPFVNSKITGALVELDVLFSGCVLKIGGGLVVGDAVVAGTLATVLVGAGVGTTVATTGMEVTAGTKPFGLQATLTVKNRAVIRN